MRMNMKKLIRSVCALLESFAVVAITFFLGMLFCSAVVLLTEAWVIPTLGRLSYDWFIYFERMETLPPAVEDALIAVSSLVGLFPAATLATRWMKGRRKSFVKETEGMISPRDGFLFYLKRWGVYDGIAMVVSSFVAVGWYIGNGRWFYSVGAVFSEWTGPFFGWILGLVWLAAAMAVAVFFAEKSWRATYFCVHVN